MSAAAGIFTGFMMAFGHSSERSAQKQEEHAERLQMDITAIQRQRQRRQMARERRRQEAEVTATTEAAGAGRGSARPAAISSLRQQHRSGETDLARIEHMEREQFQLRRYAARDRRRGSIFRSLGSMGSMFGGS